MHQNFAELEETELVRDWQLYCPPHAESYPISLAELRLFELMARKLNLVIVRDDKRRRLQVKNDLAQDSIEEDEESLTGGLRYPSGWTARVIEDQAAGSTYEAIDPEAAAPLVPAFPDAWLSEHFQLSEFRPGEHSYKYVRISPALIATLEVIRERAGTPLMVTSGYRPVAYNRKIGGVSNSTHIDGLAADIYTEDMSIEDLHAICEEVIGDRGGVGFYPNSGFVHVDLRGYRARWSGS